VTRATTASTSAATPPPSAPAAASPTTRTTDRDASNDFTAGRDGRGEASRIRAQRRLGIQLIDYSEPQPTSFHFHDLLIAENVDGGVTWQCCGDSCEDLDGWPGDERC